MGERSNSITRKKFLNLSGGAVGAGLIATSGFSSSTIAQSTDLLHRTIHSTGEKVPAVGLGTALEFGDITANYSKRRSEEHTSELQSRSDLVCRLLLEKKKKK